ncbi:MAG: chemoreceptor glutamine deamidase CheD [Gammaproteobacteria bacterium]
MSALKKSSSHIKGFEHYNKYYDKSLKTYMVKISPGDYYITDQDEVITTVLGSCISACIRDVRMGIGGMNHFMIPIKCPHTSHPEQDMDTRYGTYAMEHLINDIYKHGGTRKNLEIKLFGAGNVLVGSGNVGAKNIKFVRDFIHTEGYKIASENLGGDNPRKINYSPITGKVMMKKLASTNLAEIQREEKKLQTKVETTPVAGEIDLF